MNKKLPINVTSEIGELQGVILHTPGVEVENMTPTEAHRALYSDILNLDIARKEYAQLSGVLQKVTQTFQVKELLLQVLANDQAKLELITRICQHEGVMDLMDRLCQMPPKQLAGVLIEGLPALRNSLTSFLSNERYALPPLYNFYFTRDASMSIYNQVLIGKMANRVRDRETLIMEAIFNSSGVFQTTTINPQQAAAMPQLSIEGGDVLVGRDDILIIGSSARTTTLGIDLIANQVRPMDPEKEFHILVQELPHSPESFIHLDMVFTLLDVNSCMVFEPLILKPNRYQTVHLTVQNGKIKQIKRADNLLAALKGLGMDLKPVSCGGSVDTWTQEREQWHSGANFFAIAPGKVIGYGRNTYTLEEMNRNGYSIIRAKDVISGKANVDDYSKCVITLDGSELARGGGGGRCMTMPVNRKSVKW